MANQKVLDQKTKSLVERYLDKVSAAGIKVSKAFVFGSHATGRATRHSDVDLAVVSPDFGKNPHKELVDLFKLVDVETRELEPVPFSPQELGNKFNPLAAEVCRHGITVYP